MSNPWRSRFLTRWFPKKQPGRIDPLKLGLGPEAGQNAPRSGQLDSDFRQVADAAEKGSVRAQSDLGSKFASGQGVDHDDSTARKWFRRAAQQGDAGAQFQLGNLCHPAGQLSQSDSIGEARIESYMWFHLAAAQGHRNAEAACEMLNLQMTDAELREGNRRASAFQPRKESFVEERVS